MKNDEYCLIHMNFVAVWTECNQHSQNIHRNIFSLNQVHHLKLLIMSRFTYLHKFRLIICLFSLCCRLLSSQCLSLLNRINSIYLKIHHCIHWWLRFTTMLLFRIVDHVKVMNQERDEHILIDYNLLNIFIHLHSSSIQIIIFQSLFIYEYESCMKHSHSQLCITVWTMSALCVNFQIFSIVSKRDSNSWFSQRNYQLEFSWFFFSLISCFLSIYFKSRCWVSSSFHIFAVIK